MTENETGTPGGDNLADGGNTGDAGLDTGGTGQPTLQEWDNLPKSWTKDLEGEWKLAPEKVRQFVHRREQDVDKGIRTYADGAGRWNKLHGVFADVAKEHPDLDVQGLYEGLARNHLALVQTPPEQRKELFLRIAQHYGVDFANAAAAGPNDGSGGDSLTAAQRKELEKLVSPIMDQVKAFSQHLTAQQTQELSKKVDAFFSDPKNEFVNEVGTDMVQIVKSGITKDLGEAYELAVLRNASVKPKYLASLAAKAGGNQGTGTGGLNIKSTGAPASSGQPKTIDETMAAVVEKHYGKQN